MWILPPTKFPSRRWYLERLALYVAVAVMAAAMFLAASAIMRLAVVAWST